MPYRTLSVIMNEIWFPLGIDASDNLPFCCRLWHLWHLWHLFSKTFSHAGGQEKFSRKVSRPPTWERFQEKPVTGVILSPGSKSHSSILSKSLRYRKRVIKSDWKKNEESLLIISYFPHSWLKEMTTNEDGNMTRWDRGTLPIRNLYFWMVRFEFWRMM